MAITQKPFPPRPVQNGGNKPQQGMRGKRVEKENPNRINEEITAPTVRLVGENVEPNTGVSLPFISYGGTAAVFLLLELGVVFNISSQIKLER